MDDKVASIACSPLAPCRHDMPSPQEFASLCANDSENDSLKAKAVDAVLEELQRSWGQCHALYMHGSAITSNKPPEDIDLFAVVDEHPDINVRHGTPQAQFKLGPFEVSVYTRRYWLDHLDLNDMQLLTCQFLPDQFVLHQDEQFRVAVNKVEIRPLQLFETTKATATRSNWRKARRCFEEGEYYKSCKCAWYAFRNVNLASQILRYRRIVDLSAANHMWDQISRHYHKFFNEARPDDWSLVAALWQQRLVKELSRLCDLALLRNQTREEVDLPPEGVGLENELEKMRSGSNEMQTSKTERAFFAVSGITKTQKAWPSSSPAPLTEDKIAPPPTLSQTPPKFESSSSSSRWLPLPECALCVKPHEKDDYDADFELDSGAALATCGHCDGQCVLQLSRRGDEAACPKCNVRWDVFPELPELPTWYAGVHKPMFFDEYPALAVWESIYGEAGLQQLEDEMEIISERRVEADKRIAELQGQFEKVELPGAMIVQLHRQRNCFAGSKLSGQVIFHIPGAMSLDAASLKSKVARKMGVYVQAVKLLEDGCKIADHDSMSDKQIIIASISTPLDQFIADQRAGDECIVKENRRMVYDAWADFHHPEKRGSPATQWQRLTIELMFMNWTVSRHSKLKKMALLEDLQAYLQPRTVEETSPLSLDTEDDPDRYEECAITEEVYPESNEIGRLGNSNMSGCRS